MLSHTPFLLFCSSFIFVINYIVTFKIYRVDSWSSVCTHGISFFLGVYFSFSRISSALIPPVNSFLTTFSASAFLFSQCWPMCIVALLSFLHQRHLHQLLLNRHLCLTSEPFFLPHHAIYPSAYRY